MALGVFVRSSAVLLAAGLGTRCSFGDELLTHTNIILLFLSQKKEPWQVVQPAMEHGSAYRATTTLRRVALPYYQRAFFCKGFGAVWAGATPCLPHFLRLPSAHFCALIVFIHHDCACAWSVMIAETATTPIVTAKACTTRMSNSLSCVRAFSMGSSPRPIDHGMNTVSSTSAHYRSSLNMSKLLTNNKISVESHLPVV